VVSGNTVTSQAGSLGPLAILPPGIEIEGLPANLPYPGTQTVSSGVSTPAAGLIQEKPGTVAETRCARKIIRIIRMSSTKAVPRWNGVQASRVEGDLEAGVPVKVYLFSDSFLHEWKGPGPASLRVPPPTGRVQLTSGKVTKEVSLESLGHFGPAASMTLACTGGPVQITFPYSIPNDDKPAPPKKLLGAYEVIFQVNWTGAPPPFRVGSIQLTEKEDNDDKGADNHEFYPHNKDKGQTLIGEKYPGQSRFKGSLLYKVGKDKLAEGLYFVRIAMFLDGNYSDLVRAGFSVVSGPVEFPYPLVYQVRVQVKPPATTRIRVVLKYAPPKGGGGGSPPEIPKKKEGATAPSPAPGGRQGRPFIPGPSDSMAYNMSPGIQYQYVDEYVDEPFGFAEGLGTFDEDMGGGVEDAFHLHGESTAPGYLLETSSSENGHAPAKAGTSALTGSGPPWTQLQISVDPNGSMDARAAIRLHSIDGSHAVRGLFNGRHPGFISGFMA